MIDYPLVTKLMSVSLVILLLIIAYRTLLKRWSRTGLLKEDFCELYTLEQEVNAGEVSFYVTTEKTRSIRLSLCDDHAEHVIVEKTFEPGGHIVRLDSTQLQNGSYFYVLKTDNQEIKKRMIIEN
jgi:hypothetical protein